MRDPAAVVEILDAFMATSPTADDFDALFDALMNCGRRASILPLPGIAPEHAARLRRHDQARAGRDVSGAIVVVSPNGWYWRTNGHPVRSAHGMARGGPWASCAWWESDARASGAPADALYVIAPGGITVGGRKTIL